jgi:hypothetical protein
MIRTSVSTCIDSGLGSALTRHGYTVSTPLQTVPGSKHAAAR